jgi:hypothetical protein
MTRTTIDIDATLLRELKRRQRIEGKSLGQLVSELLADALAQGASSPSAPFEWTTKPMEARVDLEDKEALRRAMDGP